MERDSSGSAGTPTRDISGKRPANDSAKEPDGGTERAPESQPSSVKTAVLTGPPPVVGDAGSGGSLSSEAPLAEAPLATAVLAGPVTPDLPFSKSQALDLAAMYQKALSGGMPTASLGAEQMSERDLVEALGARVDQYELIRQLGSGGMGHVFLARDTQLGRLVALKFLTDRDEVQAQRFEVEARTTASFNHDNVVIIYEIGEHRGFPFMALEYVQGQSLDEWLDDRRHRRFELTEYASGGAPTAGSLLVPPSQAATLIIPVVRALVSAHEKNIVHRDLKPANVMLADSGAIKVLDFGIAKMLTQTEINAVTGHWDNRAGLASMAREGVSSMTRAGTVVGTLPYMAPEQLNGGPIDHRCDIWATGILLHQMCVGEHPLAPLSGDKLKHIANVDEPMPRVSETRPELGTLGTIIDRCLLKPLEDRTGSAHELLAELETLVASDRSAALPVDHSPFAGLSAFQRSDAERFFGRDRDITSMVARLRNQQMIAVVGPSGAGKSSFVRAGVIPALERSGDGWAAFIVRPGRTPLTALAEIIERISARSTTRVSISDIRTKAEVAELLRSQPGYLGTRLRTYARQKLRRILVFVDQFEELFTLIDDPEERECFVRCLDGVADDASSPLRVLVSLRSDFLDRVADEPGAMREVIRGLLWLQPIDRAGMREALTKPVERVGYRFETPELVERMLDTLEHMRIPLPLLEFTAAKLWDMRDRDERVLSEESYTQLGGIEGALAAHADGVLAGFSRRQRQLARMVFLQLVTPERTRAIVSVGELHDLVAGRAHDSASDSDAADAGHSPDASASASDNDDADDADDVIVEGMTVEDMIDQLAKSRLLHIETGEQRKGADSAHGHAGASVELIHESLIARWPTLRRWLDENQENSAFLLQLSSAARQWDAKDRAEGFLWTGDAARDAQRWYRQWQDRGAPHGELSKRDEDYLLAVVTLDARRRRRRRQVVLGAFIAVVAVAVVLSVLVVRANEAARQVERQARATEDEAAHARNAARMAAALASLDDPTTVLVLLREAEARWLPARWSELVQQALHSGVARAVLHHPDRVHKAVFSPDGTRVVSACWDAKVRVWNADGTGAPVILRGHTDIANSAEFSPDGARVVSASYDKTVRIWNADGSGEPIVLAGHTGVATWASFSPDGRRVASGSHDRTIRIWNADGTGEPLVLTGHEDAVLSVVFSPDGTRVLSSSYDQTVRVWNADGSGEPLILRGHTDRVHGASFSPDGTRIASAGYDKTIRIWNADGTGEPLVLTGHEDFVNSAEFSPDGTRIVSSADDRTARVWTLDGHDDEPVVLRGHVHRVIYADFSPDGKQVVSASFNKSVRVWDVTDNREPRVLAGHDDRVNMAAFSPDGRVIATVSDDMSVRIWNADQGGNPIVLAGHTDFIQKVVFSPDSARVATIAKDRTVRIWNTDGTGEPVTIEGFDSTWATAAPSFSAYGERIVAAAGTAHVEIWNTDGTGVAAVLRGHEGPVLWAEFSPGGTHIVTASRDRSARVWNLAGADSGSDSPVVLSGHTRDVLAAHFSADGQRVLTRALDNTVRVWTRAGQELAVMSAHRSPVTRAALSPDGQRAVSVSADSVRLWNVDSPDVERPDQSRVLAGHDDRVDWAEFSPDGRFISTASKDQTVRVWRADNARIHLILRGHDEINTVRFSPDGKRIVTASDDHTAAVWGDLSPVEFADPRLWRETDYCMPVDRRQKLLGVPRALAQAEREACVRRVAESRASKAGRTQ